MYTTAMLILQYQQWILKKTVKVSCIHDHILLLYRGQVHRISMCGCTQTVLDWLSRRLYSIHVDGISKSVYSPLGSCILAESRYTGNVRAVQGGESVMTSITRSRAMDCSRTAGGHVMISSGCLASCPAMPTPLMLQLLWYGMP